MGLLSTAADDCAKCLTPATWRAAPLPDAPAASLATASQMMRLQNQKTVQPLLMRYICYCCQLMLADLRAA